jgi:hypothetical protein
MELDKIADGIRNYLTTVARDLRESRATDKGQDPALLARHIVVGELLVEIALNTGQSTEKIANLTQFTQLLREAFDLSDIDNKEGRLMLSLFRTVVRVGYEKAKNDPAQIAGRVALLIKVGTHAESLESYLDALNELFNKEELALVKDYFPEGKEFKVIQRQRKRWGNGPLSQLAA